MIDALRRTLVAVKDLSEQPPSPMVLVAGAGGTRYYAVDSYEINGDAIEFFLDNKVVFVCKVEGTWSLVNRDAVELVTEEEVLRGSKTDHAALEELHKELHPEEGGQDSIKLPGYL